jgi:hypothetical protein
MAFIGRYTPNQTRLLTILKEIGGNPADSKRIVSLHYLRRRRPQNAQRSVVCVLNSLVDKVKKNGEKFRIVKSKRCGPYPIEYWMEKR